MLVHCGVQSRKWLMALLHISALHWQVLEGWCWRDKHFLSQEESDSSKPHGSRWNTITFALTVLITTVSVQKRVTAAKHLVVISVSGNLSNELIFALHFPIWHCFGAEETTSFFSLSTFLLIYNDWLHFISRLESLFPFPPQLPLRWNKRLFSIELPSTADLSLSM